MSFLQEFVLKKIENSNLGYGLYNFDWI